MRCPPGGAVTTNLCWRRSTSGLFCVVRRRPTTFFVVVCQGGYDHFMQKEIHEQPESLTQTMRGRVRQFDSARQPDPYLVPRIKLGGLADNYPVSNRQRSGARRG